jgi:PAS domain S-box-containing protein
VNNLNDNNNTAENQDGNSEIKHQLFAEAKSFAQFGYWYYSLKTRSFLFSDEIYNFLEIKEEPGSKFIHFEQIKNLLPQAEYENILGIKEEIVSGQVSAIKHIIHVLSKDQSSKYIEFRGKVVVIDNEQYVTGTALDITDSYFKREVLEEKKKLYKNLYEKLTDIYIVFKPEYNNENEIVDFRFIDVNNAFLQKFDIRKSDIISYSLNSQRNFFDKLSSLLKISCITGEPQQDRLFISEFDTFYDVLIFLPTPDTVATVWRDVSLLVDADNSVRESEIKYRELFLRNHDALFMVESLTGRILDVNTAGVKMSGHSKDELTGSEMYDLINNSESLIELLNKKHSINDFKLNMIRKDQSLLPVEASCSFFNWGGSKVCILSIRNIENRLKENKQLEENEKRLSKLFDNLNTAILVISNNTIIKSNKKAIDLFGISFEELKGKYLWELSPEKQPGNVESRLKLSEQLHLTLKNEEVEVEWLFLYDRKHVFTANMKLSAFKFKDEEYIIASIWDVSTHKRIENELIANESRWRKSLHIGNIGVWDWNIVTNEVYYSDVWKRMIGYEPDEISNRFEEFEKRIHQDDITYVFNQIEAYVEKKSAVFDVNFRMHCKNGSYKWINAIGEIYSYTKDGTPEKFVGTHIDITRYKVQEKKHIKQTNRYIEAVREAKLGVWELNLKNMVINAPDETFGLFGFSPQQTITLKSIENLVHPEDYHLFVSQFFVDEGKTPLKSCVFRIIEKSTIRFISSIVHPLYDEQQRHIGFRGFFQDVTSFKQQESHFKNELMLNKQLMKNTSQAMLVYQDDDIVYVDENCAKLLGFSENEIKKEHSSLLDLVTHEDKEAVSAIYNNVVNKNIKKEVIDARIQTKNKRVKWFEVLLTAITYNDHRALMVLLTDIDKRKLKELKLTQSETTQSEIIENNPLAVAYVNSDLNLLSANKQFNEMLGVKLYAPTDNFDLSDVFYDNDIDEVKTALVKLKTKKINVYTLDCELKSKIQIKLYIQMIQTDLTEPGRFVFYFEDIDIYRKQIDRLSDRNFIYKNVINNSKAGIALFNHKGESLLYNPEFASFFDAEVDEDSTIFFDDLSIVYNHKTLKYGDVLNNKFDEITFHQKLLLNRVLFHEIQKIDLISSEGILLIVRDITENYKQNTVLHKKLSQYASVFDHSPLGIAIINNKREIVLCNEVYAKTFKKQQDQLLNTKIDNHVKTEDINKLITSIDGLFSGMKNYVSEIYAVPGQHSNVNDIFINSYYSKYADEYGDVDYVIQIINDVTEDIKKYGDKVESEQNNLLANLAHNYAKKVHKHLSVIHSGVSAVLTTSESNNEALTIENLMQSLSTVKYENARLRAFEQPSQIMNCEIDLLSVIDDVVNDTLKTHKINVRRFFSTEKHHILANPVHMRIVFQNLLNNAIEASSERADIKIDTKIVYYNSRTQIDDIVLEKGKYLRVLIADKGEGVKEENLKSIYKPFFTTREPWSHAGLGLTIVKQLIVSYEGEILVKPNSDKGTTVSVYLPVVEDDYANTLPKPDELYMEGFNANILLVNDEEVVRTVMFELLKQLGYNIISFKNINSALQFYRNNLSGIEIVLLDENLEQEDDDELYTAFKEMNSDVDIVVLKADGSSSNIDESISYINKPVSLDKLNKVLSQVLSC